MYEYKRVLLLIARGTLAGRTDQTRDLVTALREMLSVNLETTGRFLLLHDDASEEVGESARVAVAMTHGLVEACMQVSQDGARLVEETKTKIEEIKESIVTMESLLTKAGIV